MEPKKNLKYDVHKKRSIIFNFSLMLSLLVVITAFKWVVPIKEITLKPTTLDPFDGEITYIPSTDFDKPKDQPKPRTEKPAVTVVRDYIVVDQLSPNTNEPVVDDQYDHRETFQAVEVQPEIIEDTTAFPFVEKMPEPVGGYSEFYKTLGKNLKYPKRAERTGTQGRVFVYFIIDKNGEVTNVKTIQGIGDGCDEEAMRVISMSKWEAGKQRGKPVRVKMVLPVIFQLGREN